MARPRPLPGWLAPGSGRTCDQVNFISTIGVLVGCLGCYLLKLAGVSVYRLT